tara:strand:+ start:479 stop:769 length:291 start_codon:yes stop_codon:yes gene_type:complete
MSVQKERLDYLLVKARSAALHLGILKNHILVRYDKYKYEILMIIPGRKDPERIYSNMSYIECITFLDALKIASKVVKQVKKENTDFISRHFEVIKG